MLVHHVADADCWDDFEEIGAQASIEPGGALRLQDVSEDARHRRLPAALDGGWGDKRKFALGG